VEVRQPLGKLAASLMVLKNEIRYVSLESKQHIESKLGMIDDLMSIMTGRDHQRQNYDVKGTSAGYNRPMLIRREI
jgi:hypothetical protein